MRAQTSGPPRRAERLLLALGRRLDRRSLADDMRIEYRKIESRRGRPAASLWYWRQIGGMLPPVLLDRLNARADVGFSHLKTTLRNIRRHKVHSAVNLAGLGVGLAGTILLTLFIRHELSYDRFHENIDRLYKLTTTYHNPDGSPRLVREQVSIPHGPAMMSHFPEVKHATRCFPLEFQVRNRGVLTWETITQVDADFLSMFSFPVVQGGVTAALTGEQGLVLTRAAARRLFGRDDPLGRTLTLIHKLAEEPISQDFIVTGIMENPPAHSTLQFDMLMNIQDLRLFGFDSLFEMFDAFGFETYIETTHARAERSIREGFPEFARKYYAAAMEKYAKHFFRGRKTGQAPISFGMMGLRDLHFSRGEHRNVVIILSGITLLILLVAVINFVTLALGNAGHRSLEVGVRRVLGADRRLILRQLRTESLVLTSASMLLGILLAGLALPAFNRLADKPFVLTDIIAPVNLLIFAMLVLVTGFSAGLFPALVMSRLKPAESLKGKKDSGGNNPFTRSLIVMQFAVSIMLFIGSMVMGRQIRHLIRADPGFHKSGVVVIPGGPEEDQSRARILPLLKARLEASPHVTGISESSRLMGLDKYMRFQIKAGEEEFEAHNIRVSHDFFKTLGIDITAGRDFNKNMPTDIEAAVVNECFARRLGGDRCIGMILDKGTFAYHPLTIIGVVRDYHLRSLHHEMTPTVHYLPTIEAKDAASHIYIRTRGQNLPAALSNIRSAWEEVEPERPFQYSFLDKDLDTRYRADKRWGAIVRISSLFAALISGMGIFGLTSLSVSRRIKEVGIRKVLGASAGGMMFHLSRELAAGVILANVLAWPAAFWVMTHWLQGYAYRIRLTPWPFLLSGSAALLLAGIAASWHIIRTARADPVHALRSE